MPHSHGTFLFQTTFIWGFFIWATFGGDHIHLRPHLFETTLIREHTHLRTHSFETTFIWDHIHLRPHSFETTFIWDHIHLRSYSSYATLKCSWFDLLRTTFWWSTFHFSAGDLTFCKVTLHLTFRNATTFRVQNDSRWIVKAFTLWNITEARNLFIERVWKGALHAWNVILLLDQVKELYVLHSCPFSLSRRRNIFSFELRN